MNFRLVFLIAPLAAWLTAAPHSVCLSGHLSVPFEYGDAAAVVIGHVDSHREILEGDGYYEGDGYAVTVRELIRGNLAPTVELFSENSSGRFPMDVDTTYLLFVHRERNRLMVDNCGNSGPLGSTTAVLDTVRRLQKQAPN